MQTIQTGAIGYRQNLAQAAQASISNLETELQFHRNILSQIEGTGGGGGNRAGTAGGVSARRTTTRAAGRPAGNVGGMTNREWIAALMQKHGEGLTPPQIKQFAIQAKRQVHASFPYDSIRTMLRNGQIREQGGTYWLKTTAGTGTVARAGRARTTRARKQPVARAMAASG